MTDVALGENKIVFEQGKRTAEGASVVVSLYNYESFICEALDSVLAQSIDPLAIVVVEDCATDNSLEACLEWFEKKADRFSYAALLQHEHNSGLSITRNTAFATAPTDWVFVLDADNRLYPRAVERCVEALTFSDAAFAYPILEIFGGEHGLLGTELWSQDRLSVGNYIDAMALVRKRCWHDVGGYTVMPHGWEDYDLWCKFAERGWFGLRVPQILARYRVHRSSMLRTVTNKPRNLQPLLQDMIKRHPWLMCRP